MRTILLAASVATAASQNFNLYLVDGTKGGLCLDGTPGAFYFKPGSGADSSKWMFHFEGGGWCYDEMDCFGRSQGNLGSSKAYPPTATSVGGGMLSTDCTVNPQFCNYNFVYMKYCDGDSFSGNRPDTLPVNGANLYMRGHVITQEIFEAVLTNVMGAPSAYASATDVVLSGCSAGGLATYLHTDFVATTYVPATAKFWSVPISGFFLDAPNVEGNRVYTTQIQKVWEMQQPGSTGVNSACVSANPGNEWRCNMAEYTYQHISAPIFALNSWYDSWQTGCILTSEPVSSLNSTANGNCSAVPGWKSCAGNPETCTNAEMIPYNTFAAEFLDAMNNTATARSSQNGAFISSCHTHCEALSGGWDSFMVGGVAMNAAVQAWMTNGGNSFHWDCFYDALALPRGCNPTC